MFTPPTRTRQNWLALCCLCQQCEHKCRQDKPVLFCLDPVSNLQLFSLKYTDDYWILGNWKLCRDERKLIETGSRQDKTVLSCLHLCSHCRHGQDQTRQFCLVLVGGVNKLQWCKNFENRLSFDKVITVTVTIHSFESHCTICNYAQTWCNLQVKLCDPCLSALRCLIK